MYRWVYVLLERLLVLEVCFARLAIFPIYAPYVYSALTYIPAFKEHLIDDETTAKKHYTK